MSYVNTSIYPEYPVYEWIQHEWSKWELDDEWNKLHFNLEENEDIKSKREEEAKAYKEKNQNQSFSQIFNEYFNPK